VINREISMHDAEKLSVVEFLQHKIEETGKSVDELAAAAGWADPKPLHLVLAGTVKLSTGLIPTVAKVLQVDEAELVDVCGQDYFTGFWAIAKGAFPALQLTGAERRFIRSLRRQVGDAMNEVSIAGAEGVIAIVRRKRVS
jgi:hypothetical protein